MGRVGERCDKIGQQPLLVDIELTSRLRSDDHPPDLLIAVLLCRGAGAYT